MNLKKVFLVVMSLVLLLITSVTSADQMSAQFYMSTLNRIQGTWYDTEGHPSWIFNGGTFNGYRIVGFYDAVGGSSDFGVKMGLEVNGQYKTLPIEFQGLSSNPNRYHQYLFIDGRAYRRTSQERYYESVGGIYLGMSVSQVISLYGQPDVNQNNSIGYSKLGLLLDVKNSIVEQIRLYTYGDRRFDRTGLNASSPLQSYVNSYGLDRYPAIDGGHSDIGNAEFLWFYSYPKSVVLSLYTT